MSRVPQSARRSFPGACLLLAALAILLAGCAGNPAIGRHQLSLISPAEEARIGARQNPEVVLTFGGVHGDPELAAYVDRIGQRLAAQTGRPDIPFTFTVLDTELVNAFALPGGYVYVTRGLLALANSEAELAGVLAHEISHVTARHSAERYSQSTLAQLGIGLVGVLTGGHTAQLAGLGAQAYLSAYSRDQESEADAVGIGYLSAAGYDPGAMVSFLQQMDRNDRLRSRLSGERRQVAFFSTHPRTSDRAAQAMRIAGSAAPTGVRREEEYLAMIDGLAYGPRGGRLRGQRYGDATLGIRWDAPEEFELRQEENTVIGVGPAGSRILFDTKPHDRSVSAGTYLTRVWATGIRLDRLEAIDVNGHSAATGTVRLRTPNGARDVRLVAIEATPSTFARFLFITRPGTTERLAVPLQRATYSFRSLDRTEERAFRPMRIETVTVRRGDTVESLARRMPFDDDPLARFLALNGLDAPVTLAPGSRVKLVVD